MKKIQIALHCRLAKMLAARRLALPAAVLALSACVTINIYFPAAAAERAADKIIDEVWQIQKNGTDSPSKPAVPETKANQPAVKGMK